MGALRPRIGPGTVLASLARTMKTTILATILLFAAPSFSLAQQNESPKPAIRKVLGQPIFVDFPDGREAVVKYTVLDTQNPLSIPFQVFDSLCSDRRGMSCTFQMPYRSIYYFLVWSKHPDPEKLNQPLRYKNANESRNDSRLFETQLFTSGIERKFTPKLVSGMAPNRLVCNDFSWLPGGSKEAPTTVSVKQWNTEFMTDNPETGVSENRTAFGALNLQLTKSSPQSLDVTNVDYFASSFGGITSILISGDVQNLTIQKDAKTLCSAELKPASLASAISEISNAEKRRTPPEQEKNVYLYGQDEASRAVETGKDGVADELQDLLNSFEYVKAEGVE